MKTLHIFSLGTLLLLGNPCRATTNYVALGNQNPVSPFLSWQTAATNIQDALDVALAGSTVLVSNGIYQTGSRIAPDGSTNRIVVSGPLKVRSLYGASATIIVGSQLSAGPVRCAYLADGASLDGFTLTNGAGALFYAAPAGGVYCASTNSFASNCIIVGNSGGTYSGTFEHCTLRANSGYVAAYNSVLNGCTITRNSGNAASGGILNNCLVTYNSYGVVSFGVANNCTIVGNTNGAAESYSRMTNCVIYYNGINSGGAMVNCCFSAPQYNGSSTDTFPNEPAFVDLAGGDFRLRADSPCINAGAPGPVTGSTDFAGNPRVIGGRVDVGAYEFQNPASAISYLYLQRYGLPFDGSADYSDPDGDGMNNWQEWIAGTNPTNSLSILKLFLPRVSGSDLIVSWQSATNRKYFLQRTTNLALPFIFETIRSNIATPPFTTFLTDPNAATLGPVFYRVGVQ